jgi:hypothetical protein
VIVTNLIVIIYRSQQYLPAHSSSQASQKSSISKVTCFSLEMNIVDPHIPKKYIESVYNPRGDGNCGFRCLAQEVFGNENDWKKMKQQMLDHLDERIHFYQNALFSPEECERAKQILVCRDEEVSLSFYFTFPEHSRIACEALRRTIVVLSPEGNVTFVPFLNEPVKMQPIILQLSGLHFYLVNIKKGARHNKYLPRIYPGHSEFCRKHMYTDYSLLYF